MKNKLLLAAIIAALMIFGMASCNQPEKYYKVKLIYNHSLMNARNNDENMSYKSGDTVCISRSYLKPYTDGQYIIEQGLNAEGNNGIDGRVYRMAIVQ
jgi:thioester reductase-like protein